MLRFLAERGISPGDSFEVIDKQPFGGPLFVRFGDNVHVLGGDLAKAMRVEVRSVTPPPPASQALRAGRPRPTDAGAAAPGAPRRARSSGCCRAAGLRATLAMLGPAFVASVAYVDPGNFATNIQGGAQFGYALLWVVVLANLMAMLIQYLSAKLGIATDRNLPELCRERFPRPVTVGLWVQAELMAMATDIAEFLGAAIGLNLLFGVPLLIAGLITGAITFAAARAAPARLPPL